ncbi:MAG: JAB N-terminal domain-containing protein [Xenococcaceae cyanobacterium]
MNNRNDYKIELYRGDDRKLFGTIPFMPILRESMERILGRSLLLESLFIMIHNVPEEPLPMESPIVENLIPTFGYTYVRVYQGNFLIYQHPHRLYDVVTQTLRTKLMNQYPEEKWWGFRVDVPGMPTVASMRSMAATSTTYPTPQVKGNIEVRPYAPGEKPGFSIRRLAEAEPPIKTLGDFGVTANSPVNLQGLSSQTNTVTKQFKIQNLTENNDDGKREIEEHITAVNATESEDQIDKIPVKIVLGRSLYQDLCEQRSLSQKVEEGGFLIGKVYRDGDDEQTYLLEVTDALTAKYTGASFIHLTFTGDSFVEVKRTLRQSNLGERLLGWYHTHLFPATSGFGLSSIDVELHLSTFTIPWQLAGLINIDNNQRILRFYVRQGNKMVLCPYWIIDVD